MEFLCAWYFCRRSMDGDLGLGMDLEWHVGGGLTSRVGDRGTSPNWEFGV